MDTAITDPGCLLNAPEMAGLNSESASQIRSSSTTMINGVKGDPTYISATTCQVLPADVLKSVRNEPCEPNKCHHKTERGRVEAEQRDTAQHIRKVDRDRQQGESEAEPQVATPVFRTHQNRTQNHQDAETEKGVVNDDKDIKQRAVIENDLRIARLSRETCPRPV